MRCKICNGNLKEVINLDKQALANKYPKNRLEIKKEKKYLLKVLFCSNCKTAKLNKIISRKLMFENYFYLSSVNEGLVDHFKKLSGKLKNSKFVIDIGSNDGILLRPLKKLRINSLGVDPSKNVGDIANKKGLRTLIGFFNIKLVKKILKKFSKPDTIVASSVMTHSNDPKEFMNNIKLLLENDGTFILEIEYLLNILKKTQYERFYFDRPYYYSIRSIDLLANAVGMSLIHVENIKVHGGSLRFIIKNIKNADKTKQCKKLLNIENKILNFQYFETFNLKIIQESKKLVKNLIKFKNEKKKVIAYGAPARLSTITNFAKINNNLIEFIIDDNPLKQNRYSPGQNIYIRSKKNINFKNIDIVIVFAYEYFKYLKKNIKVKKIKFFKPIPFRKL